MSPADTSNHPPTHPPSIIVLKPHCNKPILQLQKNYRRERPADFSQFGPRASGTMRLQATVGMAKDIEMYQKSM